MTTEAKQPGLESQVFGRWGSVVRYLCGSVSVFTMCLIAVMDAVTTRLSVQAGHGWPGEWHFLIMTAGVTVCAMSFSNANKTISTILNSTGLGDRVRGLVQSRFAPKDTTPQGFYWWNSQSRTYLVVTDNTDLSAQGFERVLTPRPGPDKVWSTTANAWVTIEPAA